jgi:hypothetical protein
MNYIYNQSWNSQEISDLTGRNLVLSLLDRRSIPGRDRDFPPLHSVQTGSGAYPASYPMGPRD